MAGLVGVRRDSRLGEETSKHKGTQAQLAAERSRAVEMGDKLQRCHLTSLSIESSPELTQPWSGESGAKFALQIILIPDAYARSILFLRRRWVERHAQCKHIEIKVTRLGSGTRFQMGRGALDNAAPTYCVPTRQGQEC